MTFKVGYFKFLQQAINKYKKAQKQSVPSWFFMPALEAILSTLTPMSNPPTPTHLSRGSHGNCHHIPHLYKHMTYQLRQMAWSAGMGHSIIHILQLCVRQTETDREGPYSLMLHNSDILQVIYQYVSSWHLLTTL